MLKDLLERPEEFDWRSIVYLSPPPRSLAPDMEVLVLSDYELAPDELPAQAVERGLEEFMAVHQIQEIMAALTAHGVSEPTPEQRWVAFVHYVERDAFIDPAAAGW